jgi:alkylation response protein AidB-like acyl-CoA dehydrogenase
MDGSDHVLDVGGPVARARRVAPLLRAGGGRIEAEARVPADLMQALHEARMFRIALPTALGGDAAPLADLAQVTEAIAAADGSTAWCIGQGAGCAMSAAWLAPDVAQRVFGPADAILAWGAGAAGKATATRDGGWRVSGRWSFASGSRPATWLGAHCKVFSADGKPILRPDGRHAERTLLVPREIAKIAYDWDAVGLKGTGSDSYSIDDVLVADELALDREDLSAVKAPDLLFRFTQMHAYASAFGGVMLGIARGALDDLLELAQTKQPRGAASSLKESAVFHSELAELEARLRAARAYHLRTAREIWAEVAAGSPFSLEHRMRSRLASTFTINEAAAVVVAVYRAAGNTAIFPSNPFERRLRDALSAAQQVQGRQSHFVTVGRHLLGLPPDSMAFV